MREKYIRSSDFDSIAIGWPEERIAFTSLSLLALPVTKTVSL